MKVGDHLGKFGQSFCPEIIKIHDCAPPDT